MELTQHGATRVLGRTMMVATDVLEMIEGDAFVSLGYSGDYEYLLFYSPFDQDCKVAVVNRERSVLISVWETDFRLPVRVGKVTGPRRRLARELQQKYSISKIDVPPTWFDASIEVYLDGKVEYIHQCGCKLSTESGRAAYPELLRDDLAIIVPLVEKYVSKHPGAKARYHIFLTHPRIPAVRLQYVYKHKKILPLFQATR